MEFTMISRFWEIVQHSGIAYTGPLKRRHYANAKAGVFDLVFEATQRRLDESDSAERLVPAERAETPGG